jgi:hypothetical protein
MKRLIDDLQLRKVVGEWYNTKLQNYKTLVQISKIKSWQCFIFLYVTGIEYGLVAQKIRQLNRIWNQAISSLLKELKT